MTPLSSTKGKTLLLAATRPVHTACRAGQHKKTANSTFHQDSSAMATVHGTVRATSRYAIRDRGDEVDIAKNQLFLYCTANC